MEQFNLPIEKTVKTLIVKGASEEQPLVALVIRGDHELNEIKAENYLKWLHHLSLRMK